MTFALPDSPTDTASALRELEAQAPKHIKALMIQAAKELEDWHHKAANAVMVLDEANRLRVGQMDSESKAIEINRQVKLAISNVADMLRRAS